MDSIIPVAETPLVSTEQDNQESITPSLRAHKYNFINKECAICLEDLKFENRTISITECQHYFHNKCLDNWSKENTHTNNQANAGEKTCPNCRGQLTNINIIESNNFLQATKNSDLEYIKQQISEGADINAHNEHGENALSFAIANNKEIIKTLLKSGAEIDFSKIALNKIQAAINLRVPNILDINQICDADGKNLLCYAIDFDDINLIEKLLQKGADANSLREAEQNIRVLHWATILGSKRIIKLLVNYGANVNFEDINGKTALHIAVENKKYTIVKYFIGIQAKINFSKLNKDEVLTVIKMFIDATCNPKISYGTNGKHLLDFAIEHGDWDFAFNIILMGADINNCASDTKEKLASYLLTKDRLTKGNHQFLKYLIEEKNAKINLMKLFDDPKQLSHVINMLIETGIDLNKTCDTHGRKLIWYAVVNNDLELTKKLFRLGASAETVAGADTPNIFVQACIKDNIEMVQLIIKNLQYNMNSRIFLKALQSSLHDNNYKLVNLFVEQGANLNYCTDDEKKKLLSYGLVRNNINLVKLAINAGAGADIKLIANFQKSALMKLALENNWLDIFQQFIDMQVQINFETIDKANIAVAINTIIDSEIAINKTNFTDEGNAMLLYALTTCNTTLLAQLIAKGANCNSLNSKQRTPLDVALQIQNNEITDCINLLLNKGARFSLTNNTDNLYIVINNLIKANFDVNQVCFPEGLTLLYYAAISRNAELINRLLVNGANPNVHVLDNLTNKPVPLPELLINNSYVNEAIKIIKHSVDVKLCSPKSQKKLLMHAIEANETSLAKRLISQGIKINPFKLSVKRIAQGIKLQI